MNANINTNTSSRSIVHPIDERRNDMNTQTVSKQPTRNKKSKYLLLIPIVALLLVIAAVIFTASVFRVVSLSGYADTFVLKPNQLRMGILIIDNGASAVLQKNSHWIGPIISTEGSLAIEDNATINGPVVLFSNGLRLGENSIVDGSIVLFSGGLTLEPGARVLHNAVLFSGGLTLEPRASLRQNAVLFFGNLRLEQEASIRRNTVLFFGSTLIGREAYVYGKLVSFFGGLELAPKAVLHDDAILFFGNVHLDPEAQVRGDVIVTEGDAILNGKSTIYGRLYLSPDPRWGRIAQSSEARITRGVVKPGSIDSLAGWRIALWVLALVLIQMIKFILPPVIFIGILMALMFFLGRRTGSLGREDKAKQPYNEASPQATT